MSYTENFRKILLWSDLKKRCCRLTELFVLSAAVCGKNSLKELKAIDENTVAYVKNEDVFSRIRFIAFKLLSPEMSAKAVIDIPQTGIDLSPSGASGKNDFYLTGIRPFYLRELYDELGGFGIPELDRHLKDDCCRAAALRAMFSACGTVSSPDNPKCYIEIYFDSEEGGNCCKRLLESFSIRSGVSKRRNRFVCYIKSAEGVSDFLTVTGAAGEAIKFQVAKTDREVSNNVNRVMNCDLANIDKVRRCAERELSAIQALKKSGAFYSLSDDLRDIAGFRIANPEATHTELGALLTPQLSGSAVSRKMKQIVETAADGKRII